MAAERTAEVRWEGNLTEGSGEIVSSGSGALGRLPLRWKARAERSDGSTSPEELIAAAHAACSAMAFSNELNKLGHPPQSLHVAAKATFEVGAGGARIASVDLDVKAKVPGLDNQAFQQAADGAKTGCPVSKALAGNVEIRLQAVLE